MLSGEDRPYGPNSQPSRAEVRALGLPVAVRGNDIPVYGLGATAPLGPDLGFSQGLLGNARAVPSDASGRRPRNDEALFR